MLINLNIFIIYNILINITFSQKGKDYTHYNYEQIMEIFQELSVTCSHYIRIDTSQSRYNLDSVEGCGENKKCKHLIVFITDFDSYTLDRPVYYISGVVHGDEVIGPTSVTEFAKYFCDSYNTKRNSLYHNILKNKLIVITPMTNAYGYYNYKREEKVFIPKKNIYKIVDPNRDFPYYNSNDSIINCMQTIAARTINEIFNEFIIGGGITFHGGTSVLGYAWGNYIHTYTKNSIYSSTESPDFNAFDGIGKIMVKFSSSKDNRDNKISDYRLGDMTSTVYPLDGALEDWAYGGWENKEHEIMGNSLRPIKTCKPDSYNNYEMIWNSNSLNSYDIDYDYKLRCLMYLAEASDNKKPPEEMYGINDFNTNSNGDIFDFYRTTNYFGHIPRNMRLMYSGIDLISASIYLDVENIQIQKDNNKVIIPFLFMGCLTLKKYTIHKIKFEELERMNLNKDFLISNSNESTVISEINENIDCYFKNFTYYNLVIENLYFKNNKEKSFLRNIQENDKNKDPMHYFERPGGNYDYLGNTLGVKLINGTLKKITDKKGSIFFIKGEGPDQDWGKQENPDPKVKPQSHVVRSKLNSNYSIKNGNYSLKSNYYIYSYPVVAFDDGEIQIVDDIDSFFYEKEIKYMELIMNSNNKDYDIWSQFFCHKKKDKINENKYEKYLSSEINFDISIDIHIFQKKGNYLQDILKEKKEIKLFSQILLNDENENYHLKSLQCEYTGESSLSIKCNNFLENITGRDIRQKLANSILGFELKVKNETFLNFFGQVTLKDYNKGKYFVDFYSKSDYNDNNKMICTSNFPYYINIFNDSQNDSNLFDDIYYVLNISKFSTTKLKLNIDIKQNEDFNYNYFLLYFPYYDLIEVFDIKNKLLNVEIDISEKSNGKIVGKTVYIIPIEDEDFRELSNATFATDTFMEFLVSLNQISKNKNYKIVPCSIMSYNSFKNENSYSELRKMIERFNDIKPYINREKDLMHKFVYKHFIISTIILSLLLILILYLIIKKFKKKTNLRKYDRVIISDSTHASRANI